MANPTIDFIEFPDSGSLTADRTYVVRKSHTLTSTTAIIPANVTLCFFGGILTGSATLTGNRTRIIASPEQIFDANLPVGGTWEIEKAFPQWFGAKTYPATSSSMVDSAPAINKAILMKGAGTVFLTRGYYRINSTIEVKTGITLLGETSSRDRGNNIVGTILMAGSSSLNSYTDGFMMQINVSGNSWQYDYPDPGTIVRNIAFYNTWQNVVGLKGIRAAGGFELDTCSWHWVKQAVSTLFHYSDLRKIVNCTFSSAGSMNPSADALYAFDLNSLGDGLIFEHNGMHDTANNVKGLHLNMCNGGTINANIINNDVLIEGCKAIVYEANHMELGAQLDIVDSNVTSLNNFFWKGARPSMVVRSAFNGNMPVVKSSGDSFLYYDSSVNEVAAIPAATVNEFDVKIGSTISSMFNLEFLQSYRYYVRSGAITLMSPFGLALCKEDGTTPVTEFNDYSYNLSSNGQIMCGYNVMNAAYSNNLNVPTAYAYGVDGSTKWLAPSGNYYYKYQILWDRTRKIVGNSGLFTPYGSSQPYFSFQQNMGGLLFHLAGVVSNGNQAMLRLYRGTSTAYTNYVDIPVAGATYLYDNGISVCGFKWKALTSAENITTANTNITSVRYNGLNVECKAPAAPQTGVGTWREGDIVHNTSTSSTAFWIFLSNAWYAK